MISRRLATVTIQRRRHTQCCRGDHHCGARIFLLVDRLDFGGVRCVGFGVFSLQYVGKYVVRPSDPSPLSTSDLHCHTRYKNTIQQNHSFRFQLGASDSLNSNKLSREGYWSLECCNFISCALWTKSSGSAKPTKKM